MAGQGGFLKILNANTFRNLLTNRGPLLNQHANLKQTTRDKLKELPDKPKRPLAPYFRFMRDQRPAIIKKNPNAKLTEIAKMCGTDWSQLHSTAKDKYITEFRLEMEEYTKQYAAYSANLTDEQKQLITDVSTEKKEDRKKRNLKKLLRDTDKPKRPIGPYMQYLLEASRKENKPIKEMINSIKGKWQNISEEERQVYAKRYEADKERYEKEMKVWEAKMLQEGNVDIVRNATKKDSKPSRLRKQVDGVDE